MKDATRNGAGEPGEESDQSLVLAMRAGEERAFRDFFLRFEPLALHVARRAGVQPALRREAVDDGLGAIALHLARPTSVTPDRLGAYVAGALVMRLRGEHGTRERHERLEATAAETPHGGGESVLAGTCSAASLRASAGDASDGEVAVSSALMALLDEVRAATSEEERRVLGWLAERIPQRLIAEWTGVSHDVARKRIARLRTRLRTAVLRRAGEMPDVERASVMRVLGRGGAAPSGESAAAIDRRVRDDEAR
jgi:hypothetical protein